MILVIFYNLNDSRKVLNYLEKAVGESRLSSAAMLLVQDEQCEYKTVPMERHPCLFYPALVVNRKCFLL